MDHKRHMLSEAAVFRLLPLGNPDDIQLSGDQVSGHLYHQLCRLERSLFSLKVTLYFSHRTMLKMHHSQLMRILLLRKLSLR